RVRAAGAGISLATAVVILGLTMVPFLSPAWIHLEQDRAGSAALTGFTPPQMARVTDSIVHDLVLGGDFDVRANDCPPLSGCPVPPPVLDAAEISHMRDVRGVFGGFAVVILASLAGLLIAAWRASRSSPSTRAWAWAAVRRSAASLAILLLALGAVAVVAFDAAFELFHRILFPGGNFDFDSRTEKLVQLFPEQFWSETALLYGALAVVVSVGVAWVAARRGSAAAGMAA
ncbi:MAG TPA: DUF1461 domain-containing protein, partial [Candidatus Binatus sp.]|nr:DUF1461 domain-containing protein [Candidatus Binatus sp.]